MLMTLVDQPMSGWNLAKRYVIKRLNAALVLGITCLLRADSRRYVKIQNVKQGNSVPDIVITSLKNGFYPPKLNP